MYLQAEKAKQALKKDPQFGRGRSTLVDRYVDDDNLIILSNISEFDDLQLTWYLRGERD
jgi:hypothetical protein